MHYIYRNRPPNVKYLFPVMLPVNFTLILVKSTNTYKI
jgi:hypothetical protein